MLNDPRNPPEPTPDQVTTGTPSPVVTVSTPLATEATLLQVKSYAKNLNVPLSSINTRGGDSSGGLTNTELRATPVPISGTVTATTGGLTDTQLRATALPVSASTLPLPSGAATSALQGTGNTSLATIATNTTDAATQTTLALIKAKTDNIDVALSTRAVTGLTDTQLRATALPVSAASLPLPAGAATSALQGTLNTTASGLLTDTQLRATPVPVSGTITATTGGLTDTQLRATAVPVSNSSLPLPTGASTSALQSTLNTTASGLLTDTQLRASAVSVAPAKSATATLSNVSASASSVTVLASNAARLGATVYNDSASSCYLKLGSSASSTSFTELLAPNAYYEVPFQYTGILTGIWVSAVGSARVTELT